jgi:hypothetical protein
MKEYLMALSKDQILAAQDRKQTVVPVPEWGGEVIIKQMSGADRAAYMSTVVSFSVNEKGEAVGVPDPSNGDAKLLAFCLIDEEGKHLFTEKDIEALGEKNGDVLERLAAEALKLNAIDAKAIDEAEGKSEPIQS